MRHAAARRVDAAENSEAIPKPKTCAYSPRRLHLIRGPDPHPIVPLAVASGHCIIVPCTFQLREPP
jgi:hypothetical protein